MAGSASEKEKRNTADFFNGTSYDDLTSGSAAGKENEVVPDNLSDDETALDQNSTTLDRTERTGSDRRKSHASDTNVTAAATSRLPEKTQKPWYKTPSPLRWGKIPPVPQDREVCPEHKAGFFSSLIFQWMAPLMQVGICDALYRVDPHRLL